MQNIKNLEVGKWGLTVLLSPVILLVGVVVTVYALFTGLSGVDGHG